MKTYYHVTESKKIPSIKKKGLQRSHRKNVRTSKKGVNYVMKDLMHSGFFASEMSRKTGKDVSIVHVKVNPKKLKKDKNTGAIIGSWYEYHSDVKPSHITKVEKWGKKTKKRHKKLMDAVFK